MTAVTARPVWWPEGQGASVHPSTAEVPLVSVPVGRRVAWCQGRAVSVATVAVTHPYGVRSRGDCKGKLQCLSAPRGHLGHPLVPAHHWEAQRSAVLAPPYFHVSPNWPLCCCLFYTRHIQIQLPLLLSPSFWVPSPSKAAVALTSHFGGFVILRSHCLRPPGASLPMAARGLGTG